MFQMFTEEELCYDLTYHLERTFLHYLTELQVAINQISEKKSKIRNVSAKYISRGMGLSAGEQYRKTVFYVYQDDNEKSTEDSAVIVHISGPYRTFGQAVIPRFKDGIFKVPEFKKVKEQITVSQSKSHFIKNIASTFMRYHKKHTGDNIVIDVIMEEDRARVTYIPRNYGMYEINMVANGELLKGITKAIRMSA